MTNEAKGQVPEVGSLVNETKSQDKSEAELSVKHIKEKGVVVNHDTLNDWLRNIAVEAGVEAKPHIDWLQANFNVMRDLVMSERTGQKIEAGEALPGRGSLLQAKVQAASEELAEEPKRWARFVRTTLAATLRREEARGATREDEIDVLFRALRPVRPQLLPGVGELMLAARARLDGQHDKDAGYYKTRGALGDLLSERKDEASLRLRIFLYREILAELQRREVVGGAWASIVNTNANNLAVALDDLGLKKESASYMELAVVAGSAARYQGEDEKARETAASGLQEFFPGREVSPEWAALLDDMENVPGTWQQVSEYGVAGMWLVEMGAAIAQAGLAKKAREVSLSLFNADVTISRSSKGGGGISWQSPLLCRVALNGAGLLWALRHHRAEDERQRFQLALAEARGIDCAVNLLGAMATLKKGKGFSASQEEALSNFVGALLGLRDDVIESDFLRIDQFLNDLGLNKILSGGDPLLLLRKLLEQYLPSDEWRSAWQGLCETTDAANLGRFLVQTRRQGLTNHEDVSGWLAGLLSKYENEGRTWPDYFVKMTLLGGTDEAGWSWLPQMNRDWQNYARRMQAGEDFPDLLVEMAQDLMG